MKHYFLFYLLLINLTIINTSAHADENDFDKVCHYFKLLDKENNVKTMTTLNRNKFILEKINKHLKSTSNARAAWLSISNAIPNQRYELYQMSAESILNKKWQCLAMKKWAAVAGEF